MLSQRPCHVGFPLNIEVKQHCTWMGGRMGAPYEAGMGVQILMLLRFDWTIPDPIPYLLPGGLIVPC